MGIAANIINHVKAGGIVRAARHKQYAMYAASALCSGLSVWVQRVALAWLTWELTESAGWLGGVVLAQSIPSIVILPIAGPLADRVNRLLLLRITEFLNGTLACIIAVITILDLVTIEAVLIYALARGVTGYIGVPSRVTIAPTLVPKEDLSAAIGVNTIIQSSGAFIGPAIGGILIAQAGVGWAILFSGVGVYVTFIILGFIKPLREEHRAGGGGGGLLSDFMDGVRYVANHKGIGPMLLAALAASILIRPLTDLLAGFTDKIFGLDAAAFAVFMTAFGIGGVLSSIWLANRNRLQGTLNIFLGGTIIAVGLTVAFTLTNFYPLAVGLIFLLGVMGSTIMNGSQILIQSSVEGSIRARVMSLYSMTFRVAPSLGATAMGAAADIVGLQIPVATGALLFLLMWIWIYRKRAVLTGELERAER